MKTKYLFLAVLMGSISAFAQELVWTEDYQAHLTQEAPQPLSDESYRWLYETLMPENFQKELPSETFKSFRVHLKDSLQIFPDPKVIESKNLKLVKNVRGTITYASIVKKKYTYDILESANGFLINVRVHLKKPTAQDRVDFEAKMAEAQALWNDSRTPTDFNYGFKFEIVSDVKKAHYSVNLQDDTRGPYDVNWGRDWSGRVVAHEIGHMLGLGDEYQTISGKFDCLRPSLMCTAWSGAIMKHHYYFILRRLFLN